VHQENGNLGLNLEAGTLNCKVAKKAEGQEFKVNSHGVEVRVVGTEFAVEANREGAVSVTVTEGIVEVRHKGFEGNLEAGQSWSTEGGVVSKSTNKAGSAPVANPESPETPSEEVVIPKAIPTAPKKAKEDAIAAKAQEPSQEKPGVTPAKSPKGETKGVNPVKKVALAPTGDAPEAGEQNAKAPSDTIEINLPHQSQQKPIEVAANQAKAPSEVEAPKTPKTKNKGALAALAKMKTGNYDDALRELNSLQGKSLEHQADLLYLRGYCHHKKGDVAMARSLWTKMDGLDPNNPWLPKVGSWLSPPEPSAGKLR